MFQSEATPKLVSNVQRRRGTFAQEHGVQAGIGAGDQAAALDDVLTNRVKKTGLDQGPMLLGPGPIELDSTWVIFRAEGAIIEGVGMQPGTPGQGSATDHVSSTDFYWGGADSGGPMIDIQDCKYTQIRDCSIMLSETSTSNKALIGIRHVHDGAYGQGNIRFDNVAFVSQSDDEGIGMQYSKDVLDANVDNGFLTNCVFRRLDTALLFKSLQNMAWMILSPRFNRVNTFFHFEEGGNCDIYGFRAADGRGSGLVTIIRADNPGTTNGSYRLFGGYHDRQGDTRIVLFTSAATSNRAIFTATGVHVREPSTALNFDGTHEGYVEVFENTHVSLDGCKLKGQPIVRFRTATNDQRKCTVTVRDTWLDNGKNYGSQLVTSNEGGYCGEVHFQNCLRGPAAQGGQGVPEDVTVNVLNRAGSRLSHWDIDNFDGSDAVSFDGMNEQKGWDQSWLEGSQNSSPVWNSGTNTDLRAYYRMDEALNSTTLTDLVDHSTPANDLDIESDQQVEDAPLPYLERSCDFGNDSGTGNRDTGVAVDAAADDFTIFGFVKINEGIAVNDMVFKFSSFDGLIVNALNSGSINFGCGDTGKFVETIKTLRSWWHFIVTCSSSLDTVKVFVNGVKVATHVDADNQYSASGSGNVSIGGDVAGPSPFKLSRVGIIVASTVDDRAFLSDRQATTLYLQSSVCAERRSYAEAPA